jgi:hypothetical protein
MIWEKKGLVFNSHNFSDWAVDGAMIPTPIFYSGGIIRVFLTFLDKYGLGRTGFVDLDRRNLNNVLRVSQKPIFDIGKPGTFDENGCLTCSVVRVSDEEYYFYYAGFELGQKIRYRLLSGLAITNNNFELKKKFNTPVLERNRAELHFRGGPFCIKDYGIFKMWYVAGSEWVIIDGKSMPRYVIKYIESSDGINWVGEGKVCIDIQSDKEHGFGRPYVIKDNEVYKMYYSIRVRRKGYRLGYAESKDGKEWIRMDSEIGLDVSKSGWDSEMICYSAIIKDEGKVYMFYNGNQFGKSGFGYAELVAR